MSENDEKVSDLMSAVLLFRASEDAESNAWEGLFLQVLDNNNHYTDDLNPFFKKIEKEYKTTFNESAMPSRYRSAKSVIKNAYKYKVAMHVGDPSDRVVRGKTAIEKEIAQIKKSRDKPQGTPPYRVGRAKLPAKKKDRMQFVFDRLDEIERMVENEFMGASFAQTTTVLEQLSRIAKLDWK